MKEDPFLIDYDRDGDVLYISKCGDVAVRGIEDSSGIVRRYNRENELVGVIIVDFYARYSARINV